MSAKGNMVCPACEQFQPKAKLCAHCGVVIAKANKPRVTPPKATRHQTDEGGLPIKPIAIVAVIMLAGGTFFFSGNDQSAGEEAAVAKHSKSQVERLAVIRPNIANKLQVTQTQSTLRTLKTKLYILSMEWREPPTNEQGLQHLVQQGHLTAAETTDAWGRAFAYNLEWKNENAFMREYEIMVHSRGADGLSNTRDDIGMP